MPRYHGRHKPKSAKGAIALEALELREQTVPRVPTMTQDIWNILPAYDEEPIHIREAWRRFGGEGIPSSMFRGTLTRLKKNGYAVGGDYTGPGRGYWRKSQTPYPITQPTPWHVIAEHFGMRQRNSPAEYVRWLLKNYPMRTGIPIAWNSRPHRRVHVPLHPLCKTCGHRHEIYQPKAIDVATEERREFKLPPETGQDIEIRNLLRVQCELELIRAKMAHKEKLEHELDKISPREAAD